MAVKLQLTSYQKPIFEKALKDNKVKGVKVEDGGVNLTEDNYNRIVEALYNSWFKTTISDPDGINERLRVIVQAVARYEEMFTTKEKSVEEEANTNIKEGLEQLELGETTNELEQDWDYYNPEIEEEDK